jgi:hypothetical protein
MTLTSPKKEIEGRREIFLKGSSDMAIKRSPILFLFCLDHMIGP